MSAALTEEDFKAWLDHPVTREVKKMCAMKRADLRNEWETSEPASYVDQAFVLGSVANVGMCRGLAWVEALSYEDYITELENVERVGAQAPGSSSAG